MQRTTTLIATIGAGFESVAVRVAEAAGNIALEVAPEPVESLIDWVDRLRPAWRAAQRRSAIYTVLTGDPLEPVVREWARRLEGHPSELELAIGLTQDTPLPDFYFVDPGISGSLAHWYLDHLVTLAASRVVLTQPTEQAVVETVRRLPYGKGLPATVEVAGSARDYVPVPNLDPRAGATLLL